MKARLKDLSSISVVCMLFFLFFPLFKWSWLLIFAVMDYALYRLEEKRKMNIYVRLSLLFILSSCLFYPEFVAIFCVCLCSFLFQTIKVEPGKKLMTSIVVFGIHLFNTPSYSLIITLICILLFHLTLTILITSRNKTQLSQRLKLVITIGLGSSIAIGVIPYIANGIKKVLSLGMYSLTTVLSKGFPEVIYPVEVNEKKEERINKLVARNPNEEKVQYIEYEANPYLEDVLIIVLLILFTIMIIYIAKRRRKIRADVKGKKVNMEGTPSTVLKLDKEKAPRRRYPSTLPVRKLVYSFEKDMKGVYTRKNGESFYHWLSRINVDTEELNKRLSEIYEKSRYGEEEIPTNDVILFKKGLKHIKKHLK